MKRHKKYKAVQVDWVDSNGTNGWTRGVCNKPTTCVSIGYLIAESKKAITVAGTITIESDPQKHSDITIPRCAIKKIKPL